MEKSTQERAKGKRKPGRRGAKRSKLTIHQTEVIKPTNIEPGSRFKGYEDFIVQDIVVEPRTILYRRERWQLPSGETVVAPLPAGTVGHFGAELKRFVISQYVQGQVTVPRLVSLLNDIGIVISKRQVMRLLIEGQDAFLTEALRRAAHGACFGGMDHGRRYRCTSQSPERLLHAYRQRPICVLHHHQFQEPVEFLRGALGR
jgi:hypothetical protein